MRKQVTRYLIVVCAISLSAGIVHAKKWYEFWKIFNQSEETNNPEDYRIYTADHPLNKWIADKNKYKPAGDPYPQIIQNDDYETILSIEELYARLDGMDEKKTECTAMNNKIVINDGKRLVEIQIEDNQIIIEKMVFKHENTRALFNSLYNLVKDMQPEIKFKGMYLTQHEVPAYTKRTLIELKCQPYVVEAEALSNGRVNDERLYVLDITPMTAYEYNQDTD